MLCGAVMALVHSDKSLRPRRAAEGAGPFLRLFARLVDQLRAWRRCGADAGHLASLNDHNLRDLGLSKSDVGGDSTPRDLFR